MITILFYGVFLSQILLISYYFPKKILGQADMLLAKYPPEKYPKLYLQPIEVYRYKKQIFLFINRVICLIGFVVMITVAINYLKGGKFVDESLFFIYFLFQITPFFFIELFKLKYAKQLKSLDSRTTRQATLSRRSLFDFVSPYWVVLAVLMYCFCIAFDIYINQANHQFQFNWKDGTVIRFLALTATMIIFSGHIYIALYGKKYNPIQSDEDRLVHIGRTTRSLVFAAIISSIFMIAWEGINHLHVEQLKAIALSMFLQITALTSICTNFKLLSIKNIDFDVFKESSSST